MQVRTPAAAATIESELERSRALLARAGVAEPRLTAECLLGFTLRADRAHLFAHPERLLDEAELSRVRALIERRAGGEPLQHLTGVREFYGRDFKVSPDVLIPRPETELLVEAVLERLRGDERLTDVGTGSGAIAVTLALEAPRSQVLACDVSAKALEVAAGNARDLDATVKLWRGDLLSAVAAGSLDVVVSNPPYVAERDRPTLSREVRREPSLALFAGEDGLACYRRLIPQARLALRPGGLLALELGYDGLPGVTALLADWDNVETRTDLAGINRVLLARRA